MSAARRRAGRQPPKIPGVERRPPKPTAEELETTVLLMLRQHPGKSPTGLARLTGLHFGDARRAMQRLSSRGLIELRCQDEPGHPNPSLRGYPVPEGGGGAVVDESGEFTRDDWNRWSALADRHATNGQPEQPGEP